MLVKSYSFSDPSTYHFGFSSQSNLKNYIESKHEIVQILHHAYTYNFKKLLILIGDQSGNIIRGIWVCFSTQLKNYYGILLQTVYDMSLKWAYDSRDSLPEAELKDEILAVKGIDYDSLMDYFKLWRFVNTKMPKPLPRLQRIIPRVFATWNCMKGGSDTTTKLICSTKQGHLVPRKSSQVCSFDT